jgi:tetratricopeptide (TPR) repeat protein
MVGLLVNSLRAVAAVCIVIVGSALTLGAADPPVDPVKEPVALKKLGDEHLAKDDVRKAAEAYAQALTFGRGQFTADECVRMAVVLSWDDRLSAAIRELRLVLERDPGNRSARIHLARIYSWDGQLKRAVRIADTILSDSPNDKETLLVKANALEWDDRFNEAIPIYLEIIERDDDFDARVGLATSLLYKGDRAAAQREADTLVANDARQERQLQRLFDALDREMRPRMEIGYDYYSDSDKNHYGRYSARYGLALENHDFAVSIGRTDTHGGGRADDAMFHADFNASGAVGLALGAGVTRLHNTDNAQFGAGYLQLHGRSRKTMVSGSLSNEILYETSELISNHVRRMSAGGEISQKITSLWSVSGAYSRLRFSDRNQGNDAQVRTELALNLAPRVVVGYQLRFLDYDTQSGSGYFDPNDFVSHRASASVELNRRKYFTFFQVYGGHQKFVRNDFRTSEWVKGGRASFGVNLSPRLAISVNAAAGDFSTGSVSGYRYFTAGTKVSYRF